MAGLDDDAVVNLIVIAFSTATWLRKTLFARPVDTTTNDVVVEFDLDGDELGGTLRLRTALILDVAPQADQPFVAKLPSSVLWDDEYELRLQGDAPLFPISVVDFNRAAFPNSAGWHLEIGSDLDARLHASVRLYINSEQPRVVSAFRNAAAPSPEDRAILSAIYADVARIMVEHALNQDIPDSQSAMDKDSLGFALRQLLMRFYPGEDIAAVRRGRIDHPSEFSSELFSHLKIFGD
jgi:hypothetical protein